MLSAYIDNELTSREHNEIKVHVAECVSCATEYELLTKIGDSMLHWDETVTVSPSFTQNLMQKIRMKKEDSVPFMARIQRFFHSSIAVPAFATLFIGIFLGHYVGTILYPYRDNHALVLARNDESPSSSSLRAKINALDEYFFEDILN
jgi:hypothetical protein